MDGGFQNFLVYICEHALLHTAKKKKKKRVASASVISLCLPRFSMSSGTPHLTKRSLWRGVKACWGVHGKVWMCPQEFGGSAWIAVAQEVGAPLGEEVGGEGSLQEPKRETALLLDKPHQGGAWGDGKPRLPSPWDPPTDPAATRETRPNESKNKAVFQHLCQVIQSSLPRVLI